LQLKKVAIATFFNYDNLMYHAHIYFALDEIALATQVHENIAQAIPQLTYVGDLIPMPIGPHPLPMFEIHIPRPQLESAIAAIDMLREGLSVLIHPVQHDEVAAHTIDAVWLGETLTLNIDFLKKYMLLHKH
jgi:aromatic ring-cleaving dioxygenase